jgi:hypothetical protein
VTTIDTPSSRWAAQRQREADRGPLTLPLTAIAAGAGIGSWLILDGPQRGAALGGCLLLAGAALLGPKLREYLGLALFIAGGLLAGVSLLWLLVVGPALASLQQQVHDLTHPTVSVPSVDVAGKARDLLQQAKEAAK